MEKIVKVEKGEDVFEAVKRVWGVAKDAVIDYTVREWNSKIHGRVVKRGYFTYENEIICITEEVDVDFNNVDAMLTYKYEPSSG